jgi:hypothetical protein
MVIFHPVVLRRQHNNKLVVVNICRIESIDAEDRGSIIVLSNTTIHVVETPEEILKKIQISQS